MTARLIAVERPTGPEGQGGASLNSPIYREIRLIDDDRSVLAVSHRSNILAADWRLPDSLPASDLVLDSGTLADSLDEPHPMNWLRPGRAALDAWLDQTVPTLAERGHRALLQPHALHILSDAPSAAAFLKDHDEQCEQGRLGLALAPAAIITPSMRNDLEDHLTRIFETLGPSCDLLLLADIAPVSPSDREGAPCPAVPLGAGVLPRDHVLALVDRHVPPETPLVLPPDQLDEQFAWLGREA